MCIISAGVGIASLPEKHLKDVWLRTEYTLYMNPI